MKMKRSGCLVLTFILAVTMIFGGCAGQEKGPDYSDPQLWAYLETKEEKEADVFFICPTVYGGEGNMALDDGETMGSFLGATNMEKGIYDTQARFFAPYYRQAGLAVYTLPSEQQEPYFRIAYDDVKSAFTYYMKNYNEG